MPRGIKGSKATRPCRNCGAAFIGNSHKRFCSTDCRKETKAKDAIASFWAKVDKTGANGCWLYMGFRKWDGYGWLARHLEGRIRYLTAHRYAWILKHGQPPAGMHILHKCDNPPCCNPSHLRLGTHLDNMADMHARGRTSKGYRKNGHQVLHPDRIRPRRAA